MKQLLIFLLICFTSELLPQTEVLQSSRNPDKKPGKERVFTPPAGENVTAVFEENFNGDNSPAGLAARNWIFIDNDGTGSSTIFNGNPTLTFPAYEGPTDGYAGQNFNGAYGGGLLIDQWLISPEITIESGNILSFYWRAAGGGYDDSVYLRISDGDSTISGFTEVLGRYKVPAGSWEKFSYTFTNSGTKRFAFQYYHTNGGPGGSNSNFWGVDYFQVNAGPGPATNPSPANGELITGITPVLSWTNPGTTTNIEVFFGTDPGILNSIYIGSPVTSYNLSPLEYNTTYYWKINTTDASGTTTGDIWSFITDINPSWVTLLNENFEGGVLPPNFSIVNTNGDTLTWQVYNSSTFANSGSYSMSIRWNDNMAMNDWFFAGPFNLSSTFHYSLSFYYIVASASFPENLAVYLTSTNDGTGIVKTLFCETGLTNTAHIKYDSSFVGMDGIYYIGFHGTSDPDQFRMAVDDIILYRTEAIPVELSSFSASINKNDVLLNWVTASETNNKGFEIQRKSTGEYSLLGFLDGKGTTTEKQIYSFVDQQVGYGKYTYRLKQIDFDGTVSYSKEVELEIVAPRVFSLNQNYPNPFNPGTAISFNIPVDAKVAIKVYNILGSEVANITNDHLTAGFYSYDINLGNLSSGIYFYNIEAQGVDGSVFTSTKKMTLMK